MNRDERSKCDRRSTLKTKHSIPLEGDTGTRTSTLIHHLAEASFVPYPVLERPHAQQDSRLLSPASCKVCYGIEGKGGPNGEEGGLRWWEIAVEKAERGDEVTKKGYQVDRSTLLTHLDQAEGVDVGGEMVDPM